VSIFRVLGSHARENAVGYLALFVALGGTAFAAAALPPNSVGTPQLKNGAVTGAKVARHTLTGTDINVSTLSRVPDSARLAGRLPSAYQSRVGGTCGAGEAISAVSGAGSVTCRTVGKGTITRVTAGTGLTGGGSSGPVTLSVGHHGVGTNQLANGSVTTSKFNSGAVAPNAAELGGLGPSSFVQGGGSIGWHYLSAGPGSSFSVSTADAKVTYSCPNTLSNNGTVTLSNQNGGLVPMFMVNGSQVQFDTIGVTPMTTSTPATGAYVTMAAHFFNEEVFIDLITAHDTTGNITGTAGCYGYARVTAS
jgi:hypothetical protein